MQKIAINIIIIIIGRTSIKKYLFEKENASGNKKRSLSREYSCILSITRIAHALMNYLIINEKAQSGPLICLILMKAEKFMYKSHSPVREQ
jgi:hypothetical protein